MAETTTKKAKAAKITAVQMPSKKTMNFVHHESSINVKKMLPLILVIVIVSAVFAKFGILDPLDQTQNAPYILGGARNYFNVFFDGTRNACPAVTLYFIKIAPVNFAHSSGTLACGFDYKPTLFHIGSQRASQGRAEYEHSRLSRLSCLVRI